MLKDTTLRQYLYDLERRLDRIIMTVPIGEPGGKLRNRMLTNRPHLFVFMTRRDMPFMNNASEIPSAQRDLPQGDQLLPLRVGTGDLRRAFRSVVSTAKANGASVYDAIRFVLSAKRNIEVMAGVGWQLRCYNRFVRWGDRACGHGS